MSWHKEGGLSHLYILVTLYVVSFPASLQAVGSWVGPGNEAKQYQVYHILVTLYVVSFPASLQAVGSWVGPGNEAKQYQVYHILVTLYDGISGKIILVILRRFSLT